MQYTQLFREREKVWFERLKRYLPDITSKVLKIGNGFGNLSEMIREHYPETRILDISVFPDTVNRDHVELYDGVKIPYNDKEFETVILNLTLHHVHNSRAYFRNEILRVAKKRVILIEETYDNVFQKIHLVFRDWWMNKKAKQSCPIHWKSYFKRNEIQKFVEKFGCRIVYRETHKHHSYFKELIVVDL